MRAELPSSKQRSSGKIHYGAILGVAFALRGLMVLAFAKGDPRSWFFNQASEYGCLAQSMLSGHGYASPFCGSTGASAFLAPGYPMLVATIFALFGSYTIHAALALVALQMLFGVLIVWTLMLLAKRLLGSRVANIAGTLCAISPPAVCLPVLFWETSLSVLLLTGVVLAALYCVARPRPRNWTAVGLYCAIAMFINPSLLLTFLAVLFWMIWKSRKLRSTGPVLALVTWLVVYSIWPIRNAHALHAFVPLRTNMGYELWQGNRAGSDGTFTFALHPNANNDEYGRYAKVGELAYMKEKSNLAMAAIKADKIRFARLSLKRFAKFWLNTTNYWSSEVLTLNIAFTSLMSLVGLGLLFRRRPAMAWLLAIPFVILPAPYYLTHADFRFRLLLDPLAMLLAAFVFEECWSIARLRSRQRVSAPVSPHTLQAKT